MIPYFVPWLILGGILIVIVGVLWTFVVFFKDPHVKSAFPTLVSVLGLSLCLCCLLVIPIDILNINSEGREDYYRNAQVAPATPPIPNPSPFPFSSKDTLTRTGHQPPSAKRQPPSIGTTGTARTGILLQRTPFRQPTSCSDSDVNAPNVSNGSAVGCSSLPPDACQVLWGASVARRVLLGT